MTSKKDPNEKPPAAEIVILRKYLVDAGYSNSDAAQLARLTRTRKENGDAITESLKGKTK